MKIPSENQLLSRWWEVFRRCPYQVNAVHDSDAELLDLGSGERLAMTTDSIVEEIAYGFYPEPETSGWVAATAALSDLAAVAARPVGVLAAVTLPRDATIDIQLGIAAGLEAACRRADTYIVGGDTNVADALAVTTTGVGTVPEGVNLTRRGASCSEIIYVSGVVGRGSAVAAKAVFGHLQTPVPPFRPRARTHESSLVGRYATACMDTSDGLFASLDQMARVNSLTFDLNGDLLSNTDELALEVMQELGAPPLLAHAALHGEFELVFTVPQHNQDGFEAEARESGWNPLIVGVTRAGEGVHLDGKEIATGAIRDAFADLRPDLAVEQVCELLG